VADLTRQNDCASVAETARRVYGGVDVLVNNAGVVHRATILETSEADWDRVMEVNVKAIYLLSREVIPLMVERGGGSIINMASGWGLAAGPRAAAYCASKGAVVQLTKGMAIDHAPDGVRVNCVCPGDVDTPMLEVEAKELDVPRARFLAEAAARPMERVGYASEIATSILYLAGSESAFVTGTSLVIDGGGLLG
jgi:NAD(P)-dependent dehydrogenase (short-subunit alcohol dehydrogenase family)